MRGNITSLAISCSETTNWSCHQAYGCNTSHAYFQCKINSLNAASFFRTKSIDTSSVSCPASLNFSFAFAMSTSGFNTGFMSRKRNTGWKASCKRTVPHRPGVAPITATGLRNRGASSPRDAQSIAFFRPPGIE